MAITNIYELETFEAGTQGWDAVETANTEKIELYLCTMLRYPVASGEVISAYDPLCLQLGHWHQAIDNGSGKTPPVAIAIESGTSGEYVRGRRVGAMSVSGEYTFTGSGELYLGTTSGELLTQAEGTYRIGVVADATAIIVQL